MINELIKILCNTNILILGFGKEGKSTYKLFQDILPNQPITIADVNPKAFTEKLFNKKDNTTIICGDSYLDYISKYDLIIKTPGIPFHLIEMRVDCHTRITSQTELFLSLYSKQTVGITGTKGKSTTSSLIHHILSNNNFHSFLVGNIGNPPFDIIKEISPKSIIVFELSAHQLENIKYSPSIAIFLNLYQEHLDYFSSFNKYKEAKYNIIKNQNVCDSIIFSGDSNISDIIYSSTTKSKNIYSYSIINEVVNGCYLEDNYIIFNYQNQNTSFVLEKERIKIPGDHNFQNILAVITACYLLKVGIKRTIETIYNFNGLNHRLEYIGKYNQIIFYNDSISTIPESTIGAIKTLKIVDTIILGGHDRGIDYSLLMKFISESNVNNIIFIGDAGKRMNEIFNCISKISKNILIIKDLKEAIPFIYEHTRNEHICLLSPAAASYDCFQNFMERGDYFKEIIKPTKK